LGDIGSTAGSWLSLSGNELQPADPPGAGPAERPQHELSVFLQLELCHSLGSYGCAAQDMRLLNERMEARKWAKPWGALIPSEALGRTASYNEDLRKRLHVPVSRRGDSSLSSAQLGSRHPDPGGDLGREDRRYKWVLAFYQACIHGLRAATGAQTGRSIKEHKKHKALGELLTVIHDPRRRPENDAHELALAKMRIERNEHRLMEAERVLGDTERTDRTAEILSDRLNSRRQDTLHTHVVGALVEAHVRMHHAEHLLSHSFGDKIRGRAEIDKVCRKELELSLVLNTFAYAVSRTAQWIFAARKEENEFVREHYAWCSRTLTPTYCMWLAKQVSLLALQRRAYTWLLMDEGERAHNDFQKLKRYARDAERQFEGRIEQPAGVHIFLQGLSASADHHSGRIYRLNHAYPAALRHFDRSALQLERLERYPDASEILRNSRWHVQLFINKGKASYELGLTKQTLMCYMRALRAFLELAETESSPRANLQGVARAIEWLESVEPDDEVSKVALAECIGPVIRQLKVVRGPRHLRVLAAEILTRLAHVLFTLRLPPPSDPRVSDRADVAPSGHPAAVGEADTDHDLAYLCLLQAAQLDPTQTLIAADTLKLDRAREAYVANGGQLAPAEAAGKQQDPPPIGEQWPGGGGSFEETARVVEYVLHRWLAATSSRSSEGRERIARYLLKSFLVHTDSTNVKQAQVYRYLMQEEGLTGTGFGANARRAHRHERDIRTSSAGADRRWLEFVCLRRYSSFFPFVPRPMAFPILGGGYFVRAHGPDAKPDGSSGPFGIAIDPGPDFIDNLYRVGYRLADVHMVLVTHDDVDHMASLDPMLSLIYQRSTLFAETFKGKKLIIVGNKSVEARYPFYQHKESKVHVCTFSEREREAKNNDLFEPPPWLKIECVRTLEHRDTGGNVAQGVLLTAGNGEASHSILFTSDTGPFADEDRKKRRKPRGLHSEGEIMMPDAIATADLIVAHVSAIPLPQLRELADLSTAQTDVPETEQFNSLWATLYDQVKERLSPHAEGEWATKYGFILRQLQHGFHSISAKEYHERKEEGKLPGLDVSPLSPGERLSRLSPSHLYLDGLLWFAEQARAARDGKLLLVGELHEELGMFRTRIARALNDFIFTNKEARALTADIGLTARIGIDGHGEDTCRPIEILCSTCALDNDLVAVERFHRPESISEVCIKGEDEGVFYNCYMHDPDRQTERAWVERMERYDPFGH
jgi:tetratricopeptide (TPR) repeat protein